MPETVADRNLRTKLQKFVVLQGELLDKFAALNEEMTELLGGSAGIAAEMRTFTETFDTLWCERYARGRTGAYVWAHVRDKPNMKRLLRGLGLEELAARATNYLRSEDPYYVRSRHSFGLFVASINSHAGAATSQAPADLELDARPIGCTHTPPCKSDQEHTKRRGKDMRS